jgi:hypothetical protein
VNSFVELLLWSLVNFDPIRRCRQKLKQPKLTRKDRQVTITLDLNNKINNKRKSDRLHGDDDAENKCRRQQLSHKHRRIFQEKLFENEAELSGRYSMFLIGIACLCCFDSWTFGCLYFSDSGDESLTEVEGVEHDEIDVSSSFINDGAYTQLDVAGDKTTNELYYRVNRELDDSGDDLLGALRFKGARRGLPLIEKILKRQGHAGPKHKARSRNSSCQDKELEDSVEDSLDELLDNSFEYAVDSESGLSGDEESLSDDEENECSVSHTNCSDLLDSSDATKLDDKVTVLLDNSTSTLEGDDEQVDRHKYHQPQQSVPASLPPKVVTSSFAMMLESDSEDEDW